MAEQGRRATPRTDGGSRRHSSSGRGNGEYRSVDDAGASRSRPTGRHSSSTQRPTSSYRRTGTGQAETQHAVTRRTDGSYVSSRDGSTRGRSDRRGTSTQRGSARSTRSSVQDTRRSTTARTSGAVRSAGRHAVHSRSGRGAQRSVTTNKPLATRAPTDARARKIRQERAAAKRRRRARAGLGITIAVVGLVLAVVLVRAVFGFIAGLFGGPQEQEATTPTETPAAVTQQADVQIDLVMVGDILQHAGVFESGYYADGTRNYDHIFAHLGDQLTGADLKVVNQETLLGGTAFEFSGYPSFNGPQEMGDAEAKAGFNVVLRATNHALDMGYEGLSSELSYWRTQHPEVTVIGAVDPNDTTATVNDVYVFEKDGFKVALLNYTYDLNGYEDPRGVVSLLTEEHVRQTVQAADEMADMVVVFPHWGEEYMLEPVESQRSMAQVFMDCGADVIIGGHPHVIEPVEVLTASDGRKVPCFWSVGNFVSTQIDNENLIGGVARVTLHKASDGTCSVEQCSFVPTVTHKGVGADMTTYLLRDYNDGLASTNYLYSNGTDNTSLTVAWANEFCTQVLGSTFNTLNEEIVFGPEAFVPSEPTTTATTGDGATTTTQEGTTEDETEDVSIAA